MRNKHMLTRAAVAGGLACWALVPAAPADAVKPHKEHISEPYAFVAEDYCGSRTSWRSRASSSRTSRSTTAAGWTTTSSTR